jgi:hypothetical protein
MRTLRPMGALVLGTAAMLQVACGGGGGPPPATVAPANAMASPADAGAAPAEPGPAATTTTAVPDGGDVKGAKLADVHTAGSAAPSASAAPGAPKGAHTHDAGRGPDDIRAIVIAHRDEARACYDRALPDHPGIEGDLVVQWTIDPKGAVTQIALDTSRSKISEPSIVGCIVGIIQKIQFAASPGGFETKASYPFNFHPHHAKP